MDHKESWVPKNWFFWTMVLEKTLESSLDCKEIKLVSPKREWTLNIHWKDWCWSWSSNTLATWCEELTGKDPDAGKDWRQKERRVAEDEMVGWHHRLNGHELGQAPGVRSNLCPLSQWCHPTISSSIVPFSSCLHSFPGSESFPVNWFFASGSQSVGASASTDHSFQWILRVDFL